MTSLKMANRRVGSLFAVAALVLATVTPGLVPAFASAAQVTERSIKVGSSSRTATNVEYEVSFTAVQAAGAVVLEFCQNSPLVGAECTNPTGFNVASASVDGDFTKATTTEAGTNRIIATGEISASEAVVVELSGVANPTNAGPLYARIVTYVDEDSAEAYTSTLLGAGVRDQGGAAISITETVGVSAAVLESMTFCVSAAALTQANCAGATAPVLELGEGEGDIRALSSQVVSEGSLYSQISTNAANGAVVNLKSSTACGGLKRLQASVCDIEAAQAGGVAAGQAKFGVKVAGAADLAGNLSVGAYQIFGTSSDSAWYDATTLKLNYVDTNATGITSPYGDPILDTANAPANNKNVQLTFGASAANNTPAGNYATDLSLIATGKF